MDSVEKYQTVLVLLAIVGGFALGQLSGVISQLNLTIRDRGWWPFDISSVFGRS